MLKEALAICGGIVVGIAICYGGYRLYKYYSEKNSTKDEDVFAEKLKEKEAQAQKLNELISNQAYVEFLTANELISWFKANRDTVPEKAKMIITKPTLENMRGLGYLGENDLDLDTNIVQVLYDDVSGEVYKIRLVNYTDIESNLQSKLIETDGMFVVTAI